MANDNVTNQSGSTKGTGASAMPSTSTGSGQVGGSNKPISRNMKGSGEGDKWTKAQEEYTQDQAEFRPGDRDKDKLGNEGNVNTSGKPANTERLADTVNQTAQEAKQSAEKLANDAQAKLKDVAREAQQSLGDMTEQTKRTATAVAAEQKNMAASRLRTFAGTLRETGMNLQNEDEEMIGGYAESAADQIERFAGYLQRHDAGDLINDVRDIAQRQPEVFIAGSLAVGFLLGRFLKSSQMIPGGGLSDMSYSGQDRYSGSNRGRYNMGRGEAGAYERDYRRDTYGRGGSTYADLQYRDAMRGDAPYREEELRDAAYRQGATSGRPSAHGYDRGASYGVQENVAGGPASSAEGTVDRSTTGPGYRPEEYGNTGYQGEANQSATGAKGTVPKGAAATSGSNYDTAKSGEMDKRDAGSVRGSQSI